MKSLMLVVRGGVFTLSNKHLNKDKVYASVKNQLILSYFSEQEILLHQLFILSMRKCNFHTEVKRLYRMYTVLLIYMS